MQGIKYCTKTDLCNYQIHADKQSHIFPDIDSYHKLTVGFYLRIVQSQV